MEDESQQAALVASEADFAAGRHAEAAARLMPFAGPGMRLRTAILLGKAEVERGRFEDAERWFALAARNTPDDPAAFRRLGEVLGELGRVDQAEAAFRRAMALAPDDLMIRGAFGQFLLSLGRWAEGWPLLEGRAALSPDLVPPVAVDYPQWRGQDLAGKRILVWPEQGLGDQIQMARFAGALKARGAAWVSLGCDPSLARLFATLAGVDAVIAAPKNAEVEVPRHDLWTRSFSLPEALGITLETLSDAPYLSAPPSDIARPAGARAGLVWKASPTGLNGAQKRMPDALAERLLARGLVSLHPEDSGAADFADTAAIVESLDLVVSIDTSVAHLAGAVGKPCWTLLPRVRSDWRWLRGRTDSPWYRRMRLYRQDASGWAGLTARVLADLDKAGFPERS